MRITEKMLRFVDEYLVDLNKTHAAIRAGYSAATAGEKGWALMQIPEIEAMVHAKMQERAKRTEITADWVLARLAAEATADISDLYDVEGNVLPPSAWPKIWRQGLVQGFEVEEFLDGRKVCKVKLDSRIRRVELIGKHVNVQAFRERSEVDHRSTDGSMTPREPVYKIVTE